MIAEGTDQSSYGIDHWKFDNAVVTVKATQVGLGIIFFSFSCGKGNKGVEVYLGGLRSECYCIILYETSK